MKILVVGAGIGGLTTALSLHARGAEVTVVDASSELRPIGVGINVQPHAVRELTELGLGGELAVAGIPTRELRLTDRHGNEVVTMPRGRAAGYRWPQYSIHRGELQLILLRAVRDRLGDTAVRTGLIFEDFADTGAAVTATLRDRGTRRVISLAADALIGADGLRSTVRARLHPDEGLPLWNGIRMWRGVTEADPYLSGRTMVVAGAHTPARIVLYPISRTAEARGRALVNWVAEVRVAPDERTETATADWTREGRLDDVLPHFADWDLGLLDVPHLLRGSPQILEYPMVDRDPLSFWGRGRVTLVGDAAHPMYPVGSNGGSQAILDGRVLARELAGAAGVPAALAAYEAERRPETESVLLACRDMPFDRMLATVTERAPDGFDRVEDVLSAREIAALRRSFRQTTDIDVDLLNSRPSLG